jgi:hypothetical protein
MRLGGHAYEGVCSVAIFTGPSAKRPISPHYEVSCVVGWMRRRLVVRCGVQQFITTMALEEKIAHHALLLTTYSS